jgi:hypothetical protein
MNPLDWTLIVDLQRHCHDLAHVRISHESANGTLDFPSDRYISVATNDDSEVYGPLVLGAMEQRRFYQFVGSPNPEACYRFFNGANARLLEPFLRKFLFYHVELAYLCLFLQTAIIILERWTNLLESASSCSAYNMTPALSPISWLPSYSFDRVCLMIWTFLLALHFVAFQIGIVLTLKYFDSLDDEFKVFGNRMSGIGMFYFAFNLFLITTFFSVSTLDVILFAIWGFLFNDVFVACKNLCSLTSDRCFSMFDGFSINLGLICALKIHFLHPFITLVGFIAVWLRSETIITGRWYLPTVPNSFRRIYGLSLIFLFSFIYQSIWFNEGSYYTLIISLVRTFYAPSFGMSFNPRELTKSCNKLMKTQWGQIAQMQLLTYPTAKMRYFQFFFVFYFLRLVYLVIRQFGLA